MALVKDKRDVGQVRCSGHGRIFGSGVLRFGVLLSGVLLLPAATRAEEPLSAEFWHYLMEYGEGQGEVFDPLDYAASASIPNRAHADYERRRQAAAQAQENPTASGAERNSGKEIQP